MPSVTYYCCLYIYFYDCNIFFITLGEAGGILVVYFSVLLLVLATTVLFLLQYVQ